MNDDKQLPSGWVQLPILWVEEETWQINWNPGAHHEDVKKFYENRAKEQYRMMAEHTKMVDERTLELPQDIERIGSFAEDNEM
jgi:hypothetical protein